MGGGARPRVGGAVGGGRQRGSAGGAWRPVMPGEGNCSSGSAVRQCCAAEPDGWGTGRMYNRAKKTNMSYYSAVWLQLDLFFFGVTFRCFNNTLNLRQHNSTI